MLDEQCLADVETQEAVVPDQQPRLRVAVSGSSGLVGSALVSTLVAAGHQVTRLVRRDTAGAGIVWDPGSGFIETRKLEGLDAVVHLAGENIAAGRWNRRRMNRIRDSRVLGTRVIARALAGLSRGPRVLINASAIGFYGDRGLEPLDETSRPGTGFLADTCRVWEAATEPAQRTGLRVVRLRIGVVLSREGGALARMLPLFRLGLGGRRGSGRQYVSWISLDDLLGVIRFALFETSIRGPVNATAPSPVTNAELTRALARKLGRPAWLPVPAALIGIMMGRMGRELLLGSSCVLPRVLERTAFRFQHADLDSALDAIL